MDGSPDGVKYRAPAVLIMVESVLRLTRTPSCLILGRKNDHKVFADKAVLNIETLHIEEKL